MGLNVCEENTLMKKIVIVGDWNMRRHPLSKRLRKYIDHEELKLIRERHPAGYRDSISIEEIMRG